MGTTINDRLGVLAVASELQDSIHHGKAFSIDADGTIAIAGSFSILGKVGAEEIHFHILQGIFEKGNIRISLYEAPTVTDNGTVVDGKNLNRNYTDVHTLQTFLSPTVTDVGTRIAMAFSPLTGQGSGRQGASSAIATGRVLKRNTDYLIVIQNLDNSDVDYGLNFVWAEHSASTAN